MRNIFCNADNAIIHEKYDIKGSWVARNAKPPRNGQIFTCTHCEKDFQYQRDYGSYRQRYGSRNLSKELPRTSFWLRNLLLNRIVANFLKLFQSRDNRARPDDRYVNTVLMFCQMKQCLKVNSNGMN